MLKWKAITKEEKIKVMDKMLRYIRKNAETIYDGSAKDLYQVARVIASTDFYDFLCDHCEEVINCE